MTSPTLSLTELDGIAAEVYWDDEEVDLIAAALPILLEVARAAREAVRIIETADNRAMAADGPVSRTADEMSDKEWRDLYDGLRAALSKLGE